MGQSRTVEVFEPSYRNGRVCRENGNQKENQQRSAKKRDTVDLLLTRVCYLTRCGDIRLTDWAINFFSTGSQHVKLLEVEARLSGLELSQLCHHDSNSSKPPM